MTKDDLLKLLPPWFQGIKEYHEICKAYAYALTEAENASKSVYNNLFLETCDEPTIAYWEKRMSIYPEPGESLDVRRQRVISRWNMQGVFNERYLRDQLDRAFGAGNYDINYYPTLVNGVHNNIAQLVLYTIDFTALDIFAEIWNNTAPAQFGIELKYMTTEEIDGNAYFGGIVTETVIETIS